MFLVAYFLEKVKEKVANAGGVVDVGSVVGIGDNHCSTVGYICADKLGMLGANKIPVTRHNECGAGDGLHILRCHCRLVHHHNVQGVGGGLGQELSLEFGYERAPNENVCTARGDSAKCAGIHNLCHKCHDAAVAKAKYGGFCEFLGGDEFVEILGHIVIVVLSEWRIGALAARVERIDQVTGLCQLACGGFEVVVTAAVAVDEYDGLAASLGGVEECHIARVEGVGVAHIFVAAASRKKGCN